MDNISGHQVFICLISLSMINEELTSYSELCVNELIPIHKADIVIAFVLVSVIEYYFILYCFIVLELIFPIRFSSWITTLQLRSFCFYLIIANIVYLFIFYFIYYYFTADLFT